MSSLSFNYTFQRVEKKYLLTKDKYERLLEMISPYMQMDEYGLHTICNVYYDTNTNELIRRSIEGPKYKEKLRLRSYGIPDEDSIVFLEIKKKWNGTVFKRRVSMTLEEANLYLLDNIRPDIENQILWEIDYLLKHYKPEPKLFLAYDRTAWFCKEDITTRITFDKNIRSREYDLDLSNGDYGQLIIEDGSYVMEIKVAGAMPIWLVNILSELEIYPVSFSKYGNVYKQKVLEKRRQEECLPVF